MKGEKLICTICGKGSYYKTNKARVVCPTCGHRPTDLSHVSSEDRHRVGKNLCIRCYKKEMKIQMFDEIGGFLGNRDYTGDNNLVAMAKAIVSVGWARYYGASEYQVFKALKAIQHGEVLDMPDGPVESLER